VLIWCAVGLLSGAGLLVGRWLRGRRDVLGRARPFPAVSVVLLVALGVGALVPVIRHHRLEARLDAAASSLVGAPVRVHCQTVGKQLVDVGQELGYVRYGADGVPERATLIKRDQCSDLRDYLGSDKDSPSPDQVVAVHVLSHEARHMAGITDEAVAECGAMQRDARAAELLGADPIQAQRLARMYWLTVYPRMGDDYRSAQCRPGGARDERLPSAPWTSTG
jgi:hypothetical protein